MSTCSTCSVLTANSAARMAYLACLIHGIAERRWGGAYR